MTKLSSALSVLRGASVEAARRAYDSLLSLDAAIRKALKEEDGQRDRCLLDVDVLEERAC